MPTFRNLSARPARYLNDIGQTVVVDPGRNPRNLSGGSSGYLNDTSQGVVVDPGRNPRRLRGAQVGSLGNYFTVEGMGDAQGTMEKFSDLVHSGVGRKTAAAVSAYHGYKRNNSIVWALLWAGLGYVAPVIAPTIAVAQGYSQRKPCP